MRLTLFPVKNLVALLSERSADEMNGGRLRGEGWTPSILYAFGAGKEGSLGHCGVVL